MTGKLAVRSKDSWGWRDMQETFSVSNSATSVFVSSGEIIFRFQDAHFDIQRQGCQIFLGTKYQKGEKWTKLPKNLTNGHKKI
jgi:hypothetical protein